MINNDLNQNLSLGLITYKRLVCLDPQLVKTFITGTNSRELKSHLEKLPEEFTYSRKLYRAFKIDPTKYRPSSEALFRRLKKGLEFPSIHPIVDLTNCLSFMIQIPYGLYDLNKIQGTIRSAIGGDEQYLGLGKGEVSLTGKIVLRDDQGPFGNPSSDSLRTSVDKTSEDIMQVIFFHREYPKKDEILKKTLDTVNDFFKSDLAESKLI